MSLTLAKIQEAARIIDANDVPSEIRYIWTSVDKLKRNCGLTDEDIDLAIKQGRLVVIQAGAHP